MRAIWRTKSDPDGDSDCNIATVPDAHCFPSYTDTVAAAADTHCDSNCDAHTDSYAYNHSNCYCYSYTYFHAQGNADTEGWANAEAASHSKTAPVDAVISDR